MAVSRELYGGCSVTGLGGFSGTAAEVKASLENAMPHWDHDQYVAIITDNQPGGLEAAKKAGFIEVGSWKTVHGEYRCRLFVHGASWKGAKAKALIKGKKRAK